MDGWTGGKKEEGKDGGGGIMWRSGSALKKICEQSRVGSRWEEEQVVLLLLACKLGVEGGHKQGCGCRTSAGQLVCTCGFCCTLVSFCPRYNYVQAIER